MIDPRVATATTSDAFSPVPPGMTIGTSSTTEGRNPRAADLRRMVVRGPGPTTRLRGAEMLVLLALLGLVAIAVTNQVLPASSAHQAQLRIWVASRAAGVIAMVLLTVQIVIGLLLSHPANKSRWKLSRLVFPWHDSLWLFVLAFVAAHVVSIIVDPYAGVGLSGALIPGLSSYRSAPVALGSLALDALLVVGLTARFSRFLPRGAWLLIHRAGFGVFALGWMHGLLAGTDSGALLALYLVLGAAVALATAWRWWARPGSTTAGPAAGAVTGPREVRP